LQAQRRFFCYAFGITTKPRVLPALAPKNSDMAKIKKKLTPAQKKAKKAAKAERQKKYEWVFMNGKQVRIKREPTVDGMPMSS
jgi:hypothetical protein